MSVPRNPSSAMATVFVDELIRGGVEEMVLAPGSRSAPLAFAAHAAADAGRVRLHVRIDERSAGFLALGMAKSSRRPVPVITTSGTAVANLHPAVLEAAHAGIPLVVLSADRPAGLRETMANQTTDQVKIFGDAVRTFADVPPAFAGATEEQQVPSWRSLVVRALATAAGHAAGAPGPVHLNLQLGGSLTPDADGGWTSAVDGRPEGAPWTSVPPDPEGGDVEVLRPGLRTVLVAGDDAGTAARVLAEQANWPVLAEPTSGARTGANGIRTYRLLLGDSSLAGQIQRVVVCGHPTLSRPVTSLLSRADLEIVAVPGATGWTDPGHQVSAVIRRPAVEAPDDPGWLDRWRERDAAVSAQLDELLAKQDELTPHQVAARVGAALPAAGLLYVGSSNPVRDLDLMMPRHEVGGRRLTIANRGLAGIDGTVSSAVGAALARRSTSRAFALVGDVTFLHDSNGLVIGPGEARPDLTIVVVNDDGGSIFASLEQGSPSYAASYDKLFGTPHGVDLAALCGATGTSHRRVRSVDELETALSTPSGGIEVLEAVVRRDNRRELDAAIRALVPGG